MELLLSLLLLQLFRSDSAARCADSMLMCLVMILQLIDAHATLHVHTLTRFCESTDFKEPCSKMSVYCVISCDFFPPLLTKPLNRNWCTDNRIVFSVDKMIWTFSSLSVCVCICQVYITNVYCYTINVGTSSFNWQEENIWITIVFILKRRIVNFLVSFAKPIIFFCSFFGFFIQKIHLTVFFSRVFCWEYQN